MVDLLDRVGLIWKQVLKLSTLDSGRESSDLYWNITLSVMSLILHQTTTGYFTKLVITCVT